MNEKVKVKVVLEREHEDNGIRFPVGAVIEADELTAKFLVDQKIGHLEGKTTPTVK